MEKVKMLEDRRQDGKNKNGMDGAPGNGLDDWTQVRKQARRNQNPRTRKLVTEAKSARDLLTILAMLSIVPLDIYDTKARGKFVIKLTNNNLDHFDSENTKKKLAQKNIRVVSSFKEDNDLLVVARRVSKHFKLYTEKELMDEIKLKKQIEVKRIGLQETGMNMNMFIHCKTADDAEELVGEDLILCNLMIKKRCFQRREQIQGRQCHRCGKMGHIMFHCVSSKVCWTCGDEGHTAKECTSMKKCILCNSTEHGALYGGCPAKSEHRKALVKISQDEKKKKLPVGMRGEKKETTTSTPTTTGLTKSQRRRKRKNEKKKLQSQTPIMKEEVKVNKQKKMLKVDKQPIEKNDDKFTLEDRLMSIAAAAWGMSRNMSKDVYIQNYNKLLEDSGLGALKVNYNSDEKKKGNKKEETNKEETTVRKTRRVTISEPKEDEKPKKDDTVEGKRKRKQSSMSDIPKRKRMIVHSTTSEDEDDSSEMDTSCSEEVFESTGPRFRVRGPGKKNAIVEFKNKERHIDCNFEDDDFKILHAEISRAEIQKIAACKPECLDRLE